MIEFIFQDWIPPLKVISHGLPRAQARIVGGVEAEPHKHGYQSAVIRGRYFICGGAVISEYFVLTAGHCVKSRRGRYSVLLGSHNLKTAEESRQIIAVDEVHVHPDFDLDDTIVLDIAVLQLKTKIKMNEKVFPLNLPENNVYHGMPLVITGWGVT
ncbi:duodenase-1-like, partial [Penaeus indicus]|uniref:duodenase-1-like n=1 Tax=Penaeus indicus TaxID=29960 RepID=UPI00300CC9BB